MRQPTRHILTINVEDYYQVGAFSHLIPLREWERFEARITRNLDATLALLAEYNATATFFVSGWIAEKHPEIFAPIIDNGHEVAAQSYYQQSIREIPPPAFRDDIRRSRALVESAIGRQVLGFRIGRGWIGPHDLWALDVIREERFRYDSSLCPIGRQFFNDGQKFVVDHHASRSGDLVELPVSSVNIMGYALPFAGGNYLRQSPAALTQWALRRWLSGSDHPIVAYFHIWEIDRYQPNITAAGFWQRLRHYRNLPLMRQRIASLLEAFEFVSASDYLGLQQTAMEQHATAVANHAAAGKLAAVETRWPTRTTAPDPLSRRDVTVVVPCYNEQASIPYLERTLDEFAVQAAAQIALSYVFVDDGSSDATWQLLESHFALKANCELVKLPKNRGIGAAILAGAAAAKTELVAVIDADCTFDPHQLMSMLPLLEDDVSVVVASPFQRRGDVRHVPHWRLLLSRGATMLYRLVMHNQLTSYTSCFRIYRRAQIAGMNINNEGFCGVTEILARLDLDGGRAVECPAILQVRLLGESKIRVLHVMLDHLVLIARIALARVRKKNLP